MDPTLSIIWRAVSSALMVAVRPVFFSQLTNHPFLLLLSRHSHVSRPRFASLSLSIHSFSWGCKMSLMIGSSPQSAPSYLDIFTISSPSEAKSTEDEQQRNATSHCSVILIYPPCSYSLCVHVWHSWWLHCVHCALSSGNSGDGRIVPLTSKGRKKNT